MFGWLQLQAKRGREHIGLIVSVTTDIVIVSLSLLLIVLFTVPLQVMGVRVVNDEFVEWSPLVKSDRGPIIKYQVKFFSTATCENIIDVDSNDVLYQVNITKDFPPLGQPVHVAVSIITFVH